MKNFEIFSRINSEVEDTYTRDGVEEKNIVTSSTVILAGRVKTVTTSTTKGGSPMATMVLSGGAKQYIINTDGTIKEIEEAERDEQGVIKPVFIGFYNSKAARGNKAYDDLMKLTTPKTEGKQAAVRPDSVVMVKATKQVRTKEDGSQFVSYLGTRVYISGVAEVRANKDGKPGCWALMNAVILREKDGAYSMSLPISMLNPVSGKYDITCFVDCQPKSGIWTSEMLQSFAKRGEHSARAVLLAEPDDYVLDANDPMNPKATLKFSAWITVPEFEESEAGSNRGSVVTMDDNTEQPA